MDYFIETSPAHPEFEAFAAKIAHRGLPEKFTEIYKGRNVVGITDTPDGLLNIKSFRRPGYVRGFIYTHFRDSKARRSYEYAFRLLEMGFSTPEPIAYVECRNADILADSYYVSRQIKAEEIRVLVLSSHPDEAAILTALGYEMVRLHAKGVLMRDFSPGNIMFTADASAPYGYKFHYVDINRMEFDVFDRKRLYAMFGNIVKSSRQLEIIARAYACGAGLPEEEVVSEALLVQQNFLKKFAIKKKIKYIVKCKWLTDKCLSK